MQAALAVLDESLDFDPSALDCLQLAAEVPAATL
jgi:hypothetical protein